MSTLVCSSFNLSVEKWSMLVDICIISETHFLTFLFIFVSISKSTSSKKISKDRGEWEATASLLHSCKFWTRHLWYCLGVTTCSPSEWCNTICTESCHWALLRVRNDHTCSWNLNSFKAMIFSIYVSVPSTTRSSSAKFRSAMWSTLNSIFFMWYCHTVSTPLRLALGQMWHMIFQHLRSILWTDSSMESQKLMSTFQLFLLRQMWSKQQVLLNSGWAYHR